MGEEAVDRDVRQDVADVLVRYATAIDQKDWTQFRTCFTDDCEADYGAIGVWRSVDEITEWMAQVHDACGHTMHRISNVAVSPGDGDGVVARCYVDALVLGPDNGAGVRAAGWYDDELVRTDDGWRITRRRFTLVRQEPAPAA
jgi:3-phenylpropionate/cinnamic acid dioxygenase small subunit